MIAVQVRPLPNRSICGIRQRCRTCARNAGAIGHVWPELHRIHLGSSCAAKGVVIPRSSQMKPSRPNRQSRAPSAAVVACGA